MGFFSSIFKGVKKIGKGIGKVVKGVAKGIKNVAKGIGKGISKLGKGAIKLMGKLGPIGTIAMSFVLPGIGAALGQMWTGAASWASAYSGVGSGFINAVGKGMAWAAEAASTAGNFVKTGYKSITNTIKSGLEHVGGNIADGASSMFQSAKDFMGIKDPGSITNTGEWVGINAQETFTKEAIKANPEFLRMAEGNITKAGEIARQQGGYLGDSAVFQEASKAGIDKEVIKTAKATRTNPFGDQAQMMAEQNFGDPFTGTAKTVDGMSFGQEGLELTSEAAGVSNQAGPSTLKKILEGASAGLNSQDTPFSTPTLAPISADFSTTGVGQRGGVGGSGSAGGSFLSPSILQMLQQNAKRLEAVG